MWFNLNKLTLKQRYMVIFQDTVYASNYPGLFFIETRIMNNCVLINCVSKSAK